VKSNRPVNLDLTKFKFPITAIVSILHRISGVVLFLAIPLLLMYLSCSLDSAASFAKVSASLSGFGGWLVSWVIVSAVLYHLVAGIRHLFMDLGIGETIGCAKKSAVAMLVIFVILAVIAGVVLW
jgi:succinate dehydrogenase / fumarate reductase cytochrome b subunit